MNRSLAGIFLFAFFIRTFTGLANPVTFHGNAPEYAGQLLQLFSWQDCLLPTEKELGRDTVNSDGRFSLTIELDQTRLVFFHLGKNMVYLYAEPGRDYGLVFPPRRDPGQGDLLNPYFREDEIMAGIKNDDTSSLNARIARFDELFGPVYAEFASEFYNRLNYKKVDSVILTITQPFLPATHPFLRHYIEYKCGLLRNTAWQFKARTIAAPYFINRPVKSTDPVYMDLFQRVFENYFQFFDRTRHSTEISDLIIQKKSYTLLDGLLQKDSLLFNDSLRSLVILKNLQDEFYGMNFPRTALLTILDTLIEKNPLPEMRQTGQLIRQKAVRLLPGFEPPPFSLFDRNGKSVSLSDFRGKYIYLGFCNCFSYGCLKEFEMLKRLREKHGDKFVILTISADDSLDKMQAFLRQNEYNWTFLNYGKQITVLKDYDIRAFPTYFIIGPDGKLLLSPAPGPGENFESYMFQLMRSRGDI
jgi:peroxiredoxin